MSDAPSRRRLPSWLLALLGLSIMALIAAAVTPQLLGDSTPSPGPSATKGPRGADAARPRGRPDIYYIMVEDEAGPPALEHNFGYDEGPFLDSLRHLGFYVADRSTANYPRTFLSLASSLNMRYVNHVADRVGRDYTNRGPLQDLLNDNQVAATLRSLGYTWIHMGSWWDPTASSPRADEVIRYTSDSTLPEQVFGVPVTPPENPHSFRAVAYQRVLFEFNTLSRMPKRAGPKFVFAHIISPHAPYVFSRDGSYRSSAEVRAHDREENYLEQLIFVNRMVLSTVQRLLSGPPERRPIVIVQSDEGPYDGDPSSWKVVDPYLLARKFPILNAYYFPDRRTDGLYPSMTPVNTFRVIFDRYFDRHMGLLPDRNYVFFNVNHLYDLTDVTPQVRGALAGPGGQACLGGPATGCLARPARALWRGTAP